jgi:hypothetical protein
VNRRRWTSAWIAITSDRACLGLDVNVSNRIHPVMCGAGERVADSPAVILRGNAAAELDRDGGPGEDREDEGAERTRG